MATRVQHAERYRALEACGPAPPCSPRRPRSSASISYDPWHCYRGPPISARTFEGSFSAVWVPTIARVGAFFHIFRDLQDSHSFAPLRTQLFVSFSFFVLQFSPSNFIFFENFESISSVFAPISMKISRNFTVLKKIHKNLREI